MPKPSNKPPQKFFLEVTADATHQGKTLLGARLRQHLQDCGIGTTLVRIESERIDTKPRAGDITIATELIARAGEMPGGVAGVLAPLFAAVRRLKSQAESGAIILDWPGGAGAHRLAVFAATSLDAFLANAGITGLTFVVTTNETMRMREAAVLLKRSAEIVPDLKRVLVLNEKNGHFDFPGGGPPALKFAELKAVHDGPVMTIPRVAGDSLAHLAPLQLDMRDILRQNPARMAETLMSDELICTACQSHVGAFYARTRNELANLRLLPFRIPAQPDPCPAEMAVAAPQAQS